jgi:glycosyltransferase involved in cell wall biosynthesis
LVEAINRDAVHEAELVRVVAPELNLTELIASYARFGQLNLDEYDVVISGKYPAWMVRHRHHVIHMCHTVRGLYDCYPTDLPTVAKAESVDGRRLIEAVRTLPPGVDGSREIVLSLAQLFAFDVPADHADKAYPGPVARELIRWLDADALHPNRITKYAAISQTVARRDGYFPKGVDVDVVVPPSGLAGLRRGAYRSIFTASRLDHPKRVGLIIDALKHVTMPCSLRIAGAGPMEAQLRAQAGTDDRITFLGHIDDVQLAEEYANALVVPFVPHDEDLGLITLEAQLSAKPVVTCVDSGGSTELVAHDSDGYIVEPTSRAIAAALSRFVLDPQLAEEMGCRGERRARDITWPRLIGRLLPARSASPIVRGRQQVVVLNTYAAEPARHGGQVRVSRLFRELAVDYDVHYVAVTDAHDADAVVVSPGFHQTVIRPSQRMREIEARIAALVGLPVGDVAAFLTIDQSDELVPFARSLARQAAAVVLTHPYLYPLARDLDRAIPVVYDAHNAEWRLKRSLYPHNACGTALAAAVGEAEAAALRRARLVTAVSDDDASALREHAATLADFVVVPNGVDVDTIEFVTDSDRRARRTRWLRSLNSAGWGTKASDVAVFVGSGHPPNLEAARKVVSAAAQLPDVLFVLVGSHVDLLRGLPMTPNVIARGVVEDDELRLLLSVCSVALNPIGNGSGTNIKMLDYFAAGAPAISTPIGVRGLSANHDEQVWLAEPPDLIEAIRTLCVDPDRADRLADAARQQALSFSWTNLGRVFREHIHRVIQSSKR